MKRAAVLAALLALVMFLISGPATRLGWFPYGIGLRLFALSLPIAVIALALTLIAIRMDRKFTPLSIIALGISTVLVIVPAWKIGYATRAAPIHDITTDTADPPQFVAAVPLRGPRANPVAYGGPTVAAWQRRAYPDIAPLISPLGPHPAFAKAIQVANLMHWSIIASEPAEGRIEATDTTGWFGFKDDVVIRIRPEDGGSRIDVRSLSRVGRSDVGENAKRIRAFLRLMR